MTEILRPIGSIARALESIANREFQQVALTKGQYLYLARVAEQPGIILERLTELLKVDRATASRARGLLSGATASSRSKQSESARVRSALMNSSGREAGTKSLLRMMRPP